MNKKYIFILVLFLVLFNFNDVALTYILMEHFNYQEINPLMNYILLYGGMGGILMTKIILLSPLVAYYKQIPQTGVYALVATTLLYLSLNIYQIHEVIKNV